ncbi:MAG TPA: family 20 glycosylhydrolase [Steroidobacteraceae bacterium]|nr:family 20 glycosylhydrolase [Steroidobacteraceae bacterium]
MGAPANRLRIRAALLLTLAAPLLATAGPIVDVIPLPARIQPGVGAFAMSAATPLSASPDPDASRIANYFSALLLKTRGLSLHSTRTGSAAEPRGAVLFSIDPHRLSADPESYSLDISPDRIVLSAAGSRGLLYAAVTLWQLCTASAERSDPIELPALRIEDRPRFRWRGLMLDSARHFQSPGFILQLIDWMALHKLNVLQWHLTDDQGWRLQIRRYPRLTSVGAWRVPAGAGPAADIDPATGRPRLYGGFYTQESVRQIVAHAAQRNIAVVPEIDMPGHATAAIVAYPALGSTAAPPRSVPSDWGIYPNVLNVDEGTFGFVENVLSEVLELFPGEYVDVGGDEAVKDQWHSSPRIQARMRELGVADERGLQSYFMRRIEKFLHERGRRLVGWDEILEGGLPPRATVMSWRGIDGGVAAARLGHDAVMSPSPTLYLDFRQGRGAREPPGRGQPVTLEDLYRFNPLPAALRPDEAAHIIGLQANLWTEHVRTQERAQYMTFPRAAALAELGWSRGQDLDWPGFVARLPAQLRRYEALGIHASEDAFAVSIQTRLEPGRERVALQLANQARVGEIHYRLDGRNPTAADPVYHGPTTVPVGGELRAAAFEGSDRLALMTSRSLDPASLARRSSQELTTCSNKLVLNLEDDAPVHGPRAVFLVDILNPCWIYPSADLSHARALSVAVGQVPFNFQIGADRNAIRLDTPQSASGELEVRIDGCDGERIAVMPLAPAASSAAVSQLPAVPIAPRPGAHDLCFRFAQRGLDPLWVLDWVQPVG